MEAIFAPSSADHQSFSSYKQVKNRSSSRTFISGHGENLVPTNTTVHRGGLLFSPPPSISFSYPPFSVLYPHQQIQSPQSQPPLLPLPTSRPRHNSLPPISKKPNRPRDHSLTPKKNKKRSDEAKQAQPPIISSAVPLGPDPNDLPKDVSKVLSSSLPSSFSSMPSNDVNRELEKFSGSMIFTLSPHPSSLPLPKFSTKPKLSCTAEAAGIDAGATDNLRRLLRLR